MGVEGKSCVVTGGSGLVGRRLVEMLVEAGAARVVSLDIAPKPSDAMEHRAVVYQQVSQPTAQATGSAIRTSCIAPRLSHVRFVGLRLKCSKHVCGKKSGEIYVRVWQMKVGKFVNSYLVRI